MDLRGEPMTAIFLNQYNSSCILNIYPGSSQSSLKKLLFEADRDYHRKPQLLKILRTEWNAQPQLIEHNPYNKGLGNIIKEQENYNSQGPGFLLQDSVFYI